MYQKQWFLLCSMTSCKLPRHVHCKSNQHVSLRHALCKNRSKLVLQTAENRLQLAMKTISRLVPKKTFPAAPRRPQNSSSTLPRCLQDVSQTPPSRLPDALKSFAKQHGAARRFQVTPKTPQNGIYTPQNASQLSASSLYDGLRRRQNDFQST